MKKSKRNKAIKSNKIKRPIEKKSSNSLYFIALAISIFGFLLYSNTLTHGYVLDDFSQIKENFVTKQGFDGIATQWTTHARYGYRPGPGELYRPVPMSMFSIEWELDPDTPELSHIINVLLYALTGGILFLTLARMMRKYNLIFPLLATLFFMAHPVHVEVVANIKSRDEIVMFLMCILTLNFIWRYIEKENIKWIIGAVFTYIIALFSKENSITFIAIFPLCIYFFTDKKIKNIILTSLPFLLCAIVFILIRSNVIGAFGNPGNISVLDNFLAGATNEGTQLASVFLLLGKYLWTLLFPHPLCSDFGYNQIPLTNLGDWRTLLSLLAWVAMGMFALMKLRSKNLWSFIILFFLINFSISSNIIIMIGTSFGDRLLYSASPAFAMALAYLLMKIFKEKIKDNQPFSFSYIFNNKALWGTTIVILFLYSAKTFTRNYDWESSFTLYEKDIEVSPNSAKLNFHYGLELVKNGNDAATPKEKKSWYDKAKFHFTKATEILPAYHDAYGQLGLAYYRDKNFPKALEHYNLALKYRPNFALVHSNMGTLYSEMGDNAKAKEMYETAVQENPRMVDALRNLGAINGQMGNFTEAIKWFSQALQYAPNDPLINRYLGSAYRDAGQVDKGRPYLEKAERLGN